MLNETSSLPPDASAGPRLERRVLHHALLAWLVAAMVGLLVLAAGAASDLSLGDENYHFRKAALFAEYGCRLAYDPAYGPHVPPGIPYYDGWAWHAGLALLWRMLGQSVLVAQAYQAAWLVFLIGCAYMAGAALGGPRAGWGSLLAAATMPASLFFSAVLYTETAMLALLMAGIWLAARRRNLLGGLVFGLAFLVRPTVVMVFPAFLLAAVFLEGAGWRRRLRDALVLGLGAALLILPDLWWRYEHLGTVGVVFMSLSGGDSGIPAVIREMLREKGPATFYWSTSILNPLDVVMYVGPVILFGLGLALARLRRGPRHRRVLWLALAVFAAAEGVLLLRRGVLDVRYAMAGFFLLVLIAGLALADLTPGRRLAVRLFVAAAILQGATVLGGVLWMRHLPPDAVREMRELGGLPDRRAPGFVVCPDAVVSTYSGKPILWAAINPGPFFFTWPSEKQWFLLDYYGVQYIAVPRSRIYDDTAAKHTGGYPRSFVEALPRMPYVDPFPVIDGPWMIVYRVKSKPASEAPSR